MKIFIAANWKMNPTTLSETKRLFNSAKRGVRNIKNVEVVICSPFVWLTYLLNHKPYTLNPKLGAQDCFWEQKGAFTGEISPKMLKDLGCQYVIVGHSERRKYQKETNEMINKKIKAAEKAGLTPILCIDKISQIPKDIENWKLKTQPRLAELGGVENLIIAYEPLFAIGSGKPCSIERARKMNLSIRKISGPKIPILYGGSVNAQNSGGYIKEAGFNGLLVGGASLDVREFIAIVKAANTRT